MVEVVLHIGGEKTGSTSIQASMSGSRDRLASDGILYPRIFGDSNHVGAYVYASSGATDELKGQAGVTSPATLRKFQEGVEHKLLREIGNTAGLRKVIVSNEHLSSRLRKSSEIRKLRSLFEKIISPVEYHIVYYARPQWELVSSLYSTYIKTGGLSPFAYPLSDNLHYKLRHLQIIELWRKGFPDARLSVKEFTTKGEDFDVVKNFRAALDIGPELDDVPTQNVSLTAPAVELMRLINKYVPRSIDHRFNPARGNIQQLLEAQEGPSLGIPAELQGRIAKEFSNDNARLNELLGTELIAPRPDLVESYEAAEQVESKIEIELEVEEAVRMLSECFSAKQKQFLVQKERNEKLLARVEELRTNLKKVQANLALRTERDAMRAEREAQRADKAPAQDER